MSSGRFVPNGCDVRRREAFMKVEHNSGEGEGLDVSDAS